MHATRPARFFRPLMFIAAVAFLAAFIVLYVPQARAQFDNTAPLLLAANVDGTSLVLIYGELLSESSTPATSDYTVDIGGTDYTPSSVAVLGAEVEITLSTGAASGDTVTLDYTVGTNPVEDPAGNDAQALTSWSVTNHTGATNDRPEFSSDTITITVDENTPSLTAFGDPVAATDDDTGDTLTYELHSTLVPTFLIDTSTGQFSVFGNLDFETTSSYVAPLYVRDSKGPGGSGDSLHDDSIKVTISVNDLNEKPSIEDPNIATHPENTAIVATYTVDDEDTGDSHTWSVESDTSLEGNKDGALFQIGQTSGVLSFINAPDYETPMGAGLDPTNGYEVIIKVTDDGTPAMGDTLEVAFSVTDVNEPPSIGGLSTGQLNEGTSTSHVIHTYIAPDPEDDSLTWSLAGNDAGDFTINSSTGALTFNDVPDYEDPADHNDDNTYELIVQVTDRKNAQGGSDNTVDDTHPVTIEVLNVNEAPEITTTGSAFTTISKPEGTSTSEALAVYEVDEPEVGGDTLTWTLDGDDAARFTIQGNVAGEARLRFQAIPDFENPLDDGTNNVFNVTVQVRDSKINTVGNTNGNPDTAVDDTIDVTITVTNVDEPGTVTIAGTESGGETLTASVADIDGTVSSLSWQWARGNSASGPFTNITSNGNSASYTTVAADVGKYLRATASYTDPQGSGKSANAVTGQIGASNVEPSFSSMTATRSVAENSLQGVHIGGVVSATGGDADPLHYTLSGTDASSFDIVSTSGQIRTTSTGYNYETKNSYTVTVNVSDSKDAAGNDDSNSVDDSITVTINLLDVNEQPAISTTQTAISVAENQTSVLTYMATDVDNENNEAHDSANTLTWSVESADDGGFFQIGSTSGVLTFKAAPNFEDRQDAGGDNVYNVTVTVTDNGIDGARGASNHLSVSRSLAVTVTDVNEAPTLTSAPSTTSFDENGTGVVATYVATDPDATTGTMSWDLSGNDAGDFNITSTVNGTAELTFKSPPDYERPDDTGTNNVYDVTVRVRDNGSPRLEDTRSVAVTVNDLNETPVITGNAEPSFAEIEFDHTATASELVIGTYTATDDDNADNAGLQTLTFDVSGTDAAHFSINGSTGVLSFSIEPDFENPADLADSNMMGASDNMYEIVVEADDGQGGTGEEESVGTFTVTVTVTNVNETPEVPVGVPDESFAEIEYDADTADLDIMTYVPRDEETSTADLTLALTWSLAGTDAADFQILRDTTTGHGTLSFRNRPNFEDPTDRVNAAENHAADDNMYQVVVKISDGPNTRDYPMTVTVTNINERPEFTRRVGDLHASEIEYDSGITAADLAALPATIANQSYVYPFEARDEEGDDIIWTITGADAADFVITENPDTTRPDSDEGALVRWNIVPDFENPLGSGSGGTEFYVVTVNASDGANVSEWDFFVRIDDVNERPEFTGTPETAITLDEHDATLDASFQEPPYAFPAIATYTGRDEEGGVTWSLTGTDAGDFEIDSGGNITFKETPSFEDPKDSGGDNIYNFNVVVTDVLSKTNRRTAEQPVTVTVRDIEETGVIMVDNLSPGVGDRITFTLSDPDGGIVLTPPEPGNPSPISWAFQKRMSGGWQAIATNQALALMNAYTAGEDDTGFEIRATVTYIDRRGSGKSAESEATAAVTEDPLPNVAPRFRTGTSQAIDEGAAGRVLSERITATDRDGDNLTFGIQPGQDSALFQIDASNGQITAVGALDFETAGSEGLLFFTATLHDGKGLDANDMVINDDSIDVTTVVSVRVIDLEEDGVVTLSAQEPDVGVQLTATLTDGDGGVTGASWQWAWSDDGRTGWTPISRATNRSYTPTDDDGDRYLRARVEYTDRRGGGKSAEGISNPVPTTNRRPLFPATETGQRTVNENSRAGTNIGAPVAAVDPERNALTYTLTGTDAASFTITSTGQIRLASGVTLDYETKSIYIVTVEVHDGRDGTGATSTTIDDTQSVTITVANLEEPGTVTLSSETATIQARVPVTASLEDDDGVIGSVSWQWARSRSSTSGWANIAGATSDTFTPADTDVGGYIRATASYTDGEDSGKTAVRVSPRVGQPPPVNSAPAFPATEDGRREIPEDATGGTAVGDPVVATDFNDDPLTYTLSGTDAALFTVGANDGQLRVATGAQLDFETKRTLQVTVEVTDGANSLGDPDNNAIDDRQSVIITLTNVNEAPVVTGDEEPSFPENANRVVATYTGTDPERDTLTWSVSDTTNFWISNRGQLYFRTPPSYEQRTSYPVTITARDDDPDNPLSGLLFVTVAVTDVEEAGVVAISPSRGWVDANTRFSASLTDDDGSISNQSWQWARSRSRGGGWTDIDGATSPSYTVGADDADQYLRASVSYEDSRGSNKTASAVLASAIGATRSATNTAPAFTEDDDTTTPGRTATRSVSAGTSAGRNVGSRVRATDSDPGDVLTYALSGPDAGAFDIDPATGQIKTKDVLEYDPDDDNTYDVTVDVHDGFNANYIESTATDDTIDVTITVTAASTVRQRPPPPGGGSTGGGGGGGGGGSTFTPIVPPPVFGEGFQASRSAPENAKPGDDVGEPVTARVVQGETVTYSLSGADAALFTIDEQTGQISVAEGAVFDFEGEQNTYQVTVAAENSRGGTASIRVVIEITNVSLQGIANDYDTNGNERIDLDEAIAAVNAYTAGTLTREQATEIVRIYFAGESAS